MSFNFDLQMENPFVKRGYNNKMIYWKDITVAPHKSFEVQLNGFDFKYFFQLSFYWRDKSWDHYGVGFELALLGFWLDVKIYDHRHSPWDEE